MTDTVKFHFDGEELSLPAGLSLAAALTTAGIRGFREGPNGATRGMFCGMGVCQECLVEVDGNPNQRACMTKVASGLSVRTQSARPALVASPQISSNPLVEKPDILVVGGGAGGLSAAAEAARHGAQVLLLDERATSGGQFYKQPAAGFALLDKQQSDGAALLDDALQSGARLLDETEIWGAFAGPEIHATRRGQAVIVRPRVLIVATGAYEQPRLVPGWELPGVMTTGAAQTLWRSYRTLPGGRVAVFGNGPLNLQVADELRSGGAEVLLVAEAAPAPWTRPGAAVAMSAASPGLARDGLSTLMRLRRGGVPVHFKTVLSRVETADGGLRATTDGAGGEVVVDAVCMNYGFQPQNEILRLLGADFIYEERRGQLICQRSDECETTVGGVFAVGDCCGMGGAPAARVEGQIAGCAAAAKVLGQQAMYNRGANLRLRQHRAFQSALWRVFEADSQDYADIAQETLVCRCESVTKGDIDGPSQEPGVEIGGVKRATRVGMGRCQGRYCSHVLAKHMALAQGRSVDERAYFAPRVPIKPVPIASVLAAQEALEADDA
ncbi:MAG: FAD-dependent oxidoreductase [Hyphomicrobiales bacterium]|nr:FAD-dependent oxidoreductase [Hyphomicrobiales bacterium]MCP4998763.1 FAD-dependent oxidoreductase [Hyphomicrobiales bacterium]